MHGFRNLILSCKYSSQSNTKIRFPSQLFLASLHADKSKQSPAVIGGAAAAGGLALVAIIALAVLSVKYRIARRLLNRNKIRDVHTTQDEQMSRENAYIQKNDMIENADEI